MQTYFITTNNGKRLVTKVYYTRRAQRFIKADTSNDPQWAIRCGLAEAQGIAKDCGGRVEPLSAITRFYR